MDFNNVKAVELYTEKTDLFPVEETLFTQYLAEPGKLLDLGCGTGRTSRYLKDMGHDVVGVDIAPLMIEKAKKLHPDIIFQVGDATNLDFLDESFDYVLFSFNGLDCIYPEAKRCDALREIYGVLKKGGCFMFSSHDKTATLPFKTRRSWSHRPRHYKGYYYKEKTVYGDLIVYYGVTSRTLNTLRALNFKNPRYTDMKGKAWRYWVTWV